ncbi:MAG: ECF transporter S component [Oscillospiraceae bacterium]
MNKQKLTDMVLLSLFSAIIIILALIPGIGYIPLGVTRATTIHIPVIIGSILLGPKKGGILGGVFGLTSLLTNTFMPTITSFVFSPFYSGGNFWSLVICFIPRILTGVVPYFIFKLFNKTKVKHAALFVAGFAGSITNTLLVMNMIYIFFGSQYAAAKSITTGLYSVIIGVIGINGTIEAIVAAILTSAICSVLIKLNRKG